MNIYKTLSIYGIAKLRIKNEYANKLKVKIKK